MPVMNASSPGWTLLAVALGGLISTATAVLLERRRARRELVARTRDDRREFCMGLIDLTSQIEDLIYDVERHRDRPSHERLTEAAAPLEQ